MSVIKLTSLTMVVVLLACTALFGQSAPPVTSPQTFHIQGEIRYYNNSPTPGAGVTFEGDNISKTVSADKNGFYETDLPVGIYTMTALDLSKLHYKYVRPPFRVGSSTNVTLNVTFYAGLSCDLKSPTEEEVRNDCEGVDLFPIPSKDNVPFQLSIQCSSRRPIDRGCEYSGLKTSLRPIGRGDKYSSLKTPADLKIRVFVAYNLFTLQADDVVYDVSGRVLKATGNVVVENADGATQRADSITLKIENGQATPLLQPAHAQYPTDQYRPAGFVNDFAGMIDAKERAQLELICRDLDKTKRTQMAIVTIVSLEGLSAKEFATDLANRWGVGNKDNNRGVLILLAQRERQYRLAVGHGLESVLTDEEADRLMREIIPALKKGEFGNALVQAAERIRDEIEKKVP